MTTIIFKEVDKGVEIAYDSQMTSGSGKDRTGFDKVFVNNSVIFGVSGAVRDANILQFAKIPSPKDVKKKKIDEWVVTKLIPAMQKALRESGSLYTNNGESGSNNHTLVAVKNRVYKISSDFAMIRNVSGNYSVGSGSPYAMGALLAGADVATALEVAAELDSYTGGDLYETDSLTLLEGKK